MKIGIRNGTNANASSQTSKPVFDKIKAILSGQEPVKLFLEFLRKNNKTDLLILKNTKVEVVAPALSVCAQWLSRMRSSPGSPCITRPSLF